MKTLKQIADELGIPKQRLYRFVKAENIIEVHHEAHQSASVKYYDETAEAYMKSHFAAAAHHDEAHHDADGEAVHDAVLMQYEAVVKQCDALQKQLEDVTNDRDDLRHQLDALTAELAAEREHGRAMTDRLAGITETMAQLTAQAQTIAAMNSRPLDQITDQQTQEKPLNFWQRLFKKK